MEEEVCNFYEEGLTMNQLAKHFNCSFTKIRNILIRNNIIIRSIYYCNRKDKKTRGLDIDYFKEINTHEKAYWLGMISSDGTIQKDGYKVSLTSKDKCIILNFKKSIKSGHKISTVLTFDKRTNKTYKRYLIQICSKDFVKNIINLGITNNKSYVCDMPKIDDIYYFSFLRGIFDGDGTIMNRKNKLVVGFISSKEIVENIQSNLEKIGVGRNKLIVVSPNVNMYKTSYYSYNSCKIIFEKLYRDISDNTYLKRKYNIFKKIYEG